MRNRSAQQSAILEALAPDEYKGWRREQLLEMGGGFRVGNMERLDEMRALDESTRDAIEQRALSELDLYEAIMDRAKDDAGSARQALPHARSQLDTIMLLLCAISRAGQFASELTALDKKAERAGLYISRATYKSL